MMRIVPAKKLDELGSGKKKIKPSKNCFEQKWTKKRNLRQTLQIIGKISPKFTPKFTDSNHLIDSEIVAKF